MPWQWSRQVEAMEGVSAVVAVGVSRIAVARGVLSPSLTVASACRSDWVRGSRGMGLGVRFAAAWPPPGKKGKTEKIYPTPPQSVHCPHRWCTANVRCTAAACALVFCWNMAGQLPHMPVCCLHLPPWACRPAPAVLSLRALQLQGTTSVSQLLRPFNARRAGGGGRPGEEVQHLAAWRPRAGPARQPEQAVMPCVTIFLRSAPAGAGCRVVQAGAA